MLRLVLICLAFTSVFASAKYGESRCFSCNYAPSGYGYNGNRYAGAPQCALRKYEDANALDKWGCASGKCFVRMDKNGLIYRGCADQKDLPRDVNPYRQCEYQAGSLWHFCGGDLCNSQQIGQTCSYQPERKYGPAYKRENPCDGKCYGNPSGLFASSNSKSSFIQCGCGNNHYGNTCTCCVPFYFDCPKGTYFDAYQKRCL